MNQGAIVQLMTGPQSKWEGALNVRYYRKGTLGTHIIGTIAIPETAYYDEVALKRMLQVNSANTLETRNYFGKVILLPEEGVKRQELEFFIGRGRPSPGFKDDEFWERVEKGLPAVVELGIARRVIAEVNTFRELTDAGQRYVMDAEGKVHRVHIPSNVERR